MTARWTRGRARVVALVALAASALVGASVPAAAVAAPSAAARPADPIAHDPTMVKEGGWYYVAITGDAAKPNTYLPMKRSRDLKHWQELGPVFSSLPSWVVPTLGVPAADAPKDLWAPDLSRSHGEWRLYYAASTFGKNTSGIGLATTKSLDPRSRDYGWHDEGLVVKSTDYREAGGTDYNAIDPNIAVDRSGGTWLSFGSFFSGIQLHRIDARTGKVPAGDPVRHLAQRAAPNAEENSSIVYHRGYYYLFLSFDNCCRSVDSDYRTVVGRSKSIAGPYVDRVGTPLLNGKGGTEVMRGYNEFVGAGGADVLLGAGGRDLVVNHYYDATDDGAPKLNVRHLGWGAGGWPRVSDPINGSRSIGHGDAYVTIRPTTSGTAVADRGRGYEGALLALGRDGGTAEQWQLSDRGSGTRILNRFSNQVAENAGCRNVDGGPVALFPWLGYQGSNDCQRWSFAAAPGGSTTVSTIQDGHRSWTAAGGSGTAVVIDPPTASAAQRFRFRPAQPVLLATPQVGTRTLGVSGGKAVVQPRSSHRAQVWRFDPIGSSGSYRVTAVGTGRQLAAGAHGLLAVAPRSASSAARAWTLRPTDDGTWTLASRSTSRSVRLLLP